MQLLILYKKVSSYLYPKMDSLKDIAMLTSLGAAYGRHGKGERKSTMLSSLVFYTTSLTRLKLYNTFL